MPEREPLRVLLLGDPVLGAAALARIEGVFADVSAIIWQRGDRSGRAAARQTLLGTCWDLALSVYSDLILRPDELAQITVPLNIHPALPALRGRGYDHLPLIEGHRHYGATLHWMTPAIDAGPILCMLSRDLPADTTHGVLRRRTQALSLQLLEHTLAQLRGCRTSVELRQGVQRIAEQSRDEAAVWARRYVNDAELQHTLRTLKRRQPGHPALH